MAYVVAPEAPVIIGLEAFGLAALAGLLVGIGARVVWNYTFGAFLAAIASAAKVGVWKVKINLGGPADALNQKVQKALGAFILRNEQALGLWWHANVTLLKYNVDALSWLAHQTMDTFGALVDGTIPAIASAHVGPLGARVARLAHYLRATAAGLQRQLVLKAKALEATLEHDFGLAWRGIDHIRSVSIPSLWKWALGLGAAVAALRGLLHRVVNRRLSKLETFVLGAGLTAAIMRVLARQMPWYRCSNVRRFMRGLCRSPLGALDWLFALAALVVAALNPETMEHAGEDLVDLFDGVIKTMAGVPQSVTRAPTP